MNFLSAVPVPEHNPTYLPKVLAANDRLLPPAIAYKTTNLMIAAMQTAK